VAPPLGPRERAAIAELRVLLEGLRAPDNADWSTFRMIQRLLGKHGVVPPAMLAGLLPFVHQLRSALLPQLEAVAETGVAPPDAAALLAASCDEIARRDRTLQQIREELPGHLERVSRLLESLDAAATHRLAGGG
jgi:hypothetical protein